MLHDSKMIYEDQLAAVQADSVKSGTTGAGMIDLALLVDGLQAEREQGITIDVAYRYFSTSTRKFIIKNAGLLCLCLNFKPTAADLTFDCDEYSVDDIYAALKNLDFIH